MSSLAPEPNNGNRPLPESAQPGEEPARDGDELTDEELEWVVGGTDPQYAATQFEQLQKPAATNQG
ncbi:MAG: hypothetical protein WCF84_07530 [Anaerolineae bacterium]